jgi:hypothetical protein
MAFSFRPWFNRLDTRSSAVAPKLTAPVGAEEQFLTGLRFAGGEGVVQDFAMAAHWYGQAAEQNHSLAQLNLATLYAQGTGIERDEAKSLLWLTRSANLGNSAAQYQLGVRQHLACRNSKNGAALETRIEALKWVRLSAAQGQRGAENACEFVALGMTREEVAEAGRRVAAFVAS